MGNVYFYIVVSFLRFECWTVSIYWIAYTFSIMNRLWKDCTPPSSAPWAPFCMGRVCFNKCVDARRLLIGIFVFNVYTYRSNGAQDMSRMFMLYRLDMKLEGRKMSLNIFSKTNRCVAHLYLLNICYRITRATDRWQFGTGWYAVNKTLLKQTTYRSLKSNNTFAEEIDIHFVGQWWSCERIFLHRAKPSFCD